MRMGRSTGTEGERERARARERKINDCLLKIIRSGNDTKCRFTSNICSHAHAYSDRIFFIVDHPHDYYCLETERTDASRVLIHLRSVS